MQSLKKLGILYSVTGSSCHDWYLINNMKSKPVHGQTWNRPWRESAHHNYHAMEVAAYFLPQLWFVPAPKIYMSIMKGNSEKKNNNNERPACAGFFECIIWCDDILSVYFSWYLINSYIFLVSVIFVFCRCCLLDRVQLTVWQT